MTIIQHRAPTTLQHLNDATTDDDDDDERSDADDDPSRDIKTIVSCSVSVFLL